MKLTLAGRPGVLSLLVPLVSAMSFGTMLDRVSRQEQNKQQKASGCGLPAVLNTESCF